MSTKRRHDSPSPPRRRHDSPSRSRQRSRSASPSKSSDSRRSDSSRSSTSDQKRSKKDKKKAKKDAKKAQKRAKKDEKRARKQDKRTAAAEAWLTAPPPTGAAQADGSRVVAFGDGGAVTYPPEFDGAFLAIRPGCEVKDPADADADAEAGAEAGADADGAFGSSPSDAASVAAGAEASAAAAAAADAAAALLRGSEGGANAFFATLLAQEGSKPEVGTLHASGKKGDAVSGQGIMAGVRTSTKRATGMGGGAMPHTESQDGTGEWPCLKCGKKNKRQDGQCTNCSALKRMTQYQ